MVCMCGCVSLVNTAMTPTTTGYGEFIRVEDKSYEIGKTKTVFVGEQMIKRRDFYTRTITQDDTLVASENCTIFLQPTLAFNGQRSMKRGEEITAPGCREIDGKMCRFLIVHLNQIAAVILPNGEVMKNKWAIVSRQSADVGGSAKVWVEPETARFLPKARDVVDVSKPFVNYEIIYTGRSGNTINLLYREFTPDDLAKSAFFQSLSYEATSNTIRFRKLLIEVSKADNERISFTVQED